MTYETAFYTSGSTPSWGVQTAINPLTNQQLSTVAAYNSSGTNIVESRWAMMFFTFDETKTYTFPDTTQPSVNQYELYYSPPPGDRLMHGKDFRDQTQQDLDTYPH
jgi:hypothetical protein